MNLAPLPRVVLAIAEGRVARAEADLSAATERARHDASFTDWLAERPDLGRLDRMIKELPLRRAELAQIQDELLNAENRLGEWTIAFAFKTPSDLEEKITLYRRLLKALDDCESDALLQPLLHEPGLNLSLRAGLAEQMISRERARRQADHEFQQLFKTNIDIFPRGHSSRSSDFDVNRSAASWHRYYNKALTNFDNQMDEQIRVDLRRMECNRDDLERMHNQKLSLHVESQLSELKSRTQIALAKLSEAEAAFMCQSDIDIFRKRRIEVFVTDTTRLQKAAHDAAIRECREAEHNIISQFRESLMRDFSNTRIENFVPVSDHSLYQLLEGIQNSHERKLQEAEERKRRELQDAEERKWWKQVATQPLEEVINKLDVVPAEHIQAVLGRFLQLPATDSHILDKRVHAYLKREHYRLCRRRGVTAPVVVAYISRLVADRNDEQARELLKRFPTVVGSTLDGVASYLRFVISTPQSLCGETHFRNLSPEDLFLGACYYNSGNALHTLDNHAQWDYDSLMNSLADSSDQCLNNFKVQGLQPRIAEVAFRQIYKLIAGADAAQKLRDSNLEHINKLVRPWKRSTVGLLPSADWKDSQKEYDVKCNLFYRTRSKQEKIGLRGFLITKIKRDSHRSFPGFVFSETDNESCKWVYVGEYQPYSRVTDESDKDGIRVLPFHFRLPDTERFILLKPNCDPDLGMQLLASPLLRLGWSLATGTPRPIEQVSKNSVKFLLYRFVECCLTITVNSFLEYSLWNALTETAIDACNQCSTEIVNLFLKCARTLISDRALPIRLPRIGDEPLLSR